MKKLLVLLACVTLLSCVREMDSLDYKETTFVGDMEEVPSTKTTMNQYNQILWEQDDEVVIFEKTSVGSKWKIDASSAGQVNASFERADNVSDSGSGMKCNVAIYPYSADMLCVESSAGSYKITGVDVPAVQNYVKNSFDTGAFPMVAVSANNQLNFNNVLGGLKLRITGEGAVKSIVVAGNSGELLSGRAELQAYSGGRKPEIKMLDPSGTTVTLDCGENGVVLKNNEPSVFILALPPTQFKEGFTVTVVDSEGAEKVFRAAANTVCRSSLLRMPQISMDKDEFSQFEVEFCEAGPGYVTVNAIVPGETKVKYYISEEPLSPSTAQILSIVGTGVTFLNDGPQQLTDYPIKENTKYYLYLVAVVDNEYSEVYEFEFETGAFEFSQLATVVSVMPDGFKMHIKVPETVKKSEEGRQGSRAIRYAHADLMMYNSRLFSSDDYKVLLYNSSRYVTEDTELEFSDELNWGPAGTDVNMDGVVDENDLSTIWNPIAPGEPTVFLAGEFEWMSEPAEYKDGGSLDNNVYAVNGFPFPVGWEDGYYLPCLDPDQYWSINSRAATKGIGAIPDVDVSTSTCQMWTGAFQKKVFRTRVPDKLDGDFDVQVEALRSVNATLTITPTKNIYGYLFVVLDEQSYQYMMQLLEGHEEYRQWAVTSYFAQCIFGAIQVVANYGEVTAPAVRFDLADLFYDVPSDTKYHVLITGMSGNAGSPQCFKYFTFNTPPKTKTSGPEIEVTALPDKTTPYAAAFNVKCVSVETNPLVKCYYGSGYYKDWVFDVNTGVTNEQYGMANQFTPDELDMINSEEGYDMYIPSIDGMTTRLVVVGFNDENISNGVDTYEDVLAHPAVDDCTTPYAEAENIVLNPLLHPMSLNNNTPLLDGDWTLTATVLNGGKTEVQKSRVRIKHALEEGVDYPASLPDSVYTLYKEATKGKWTDDEIYGLYDEFKNLAGIYNEKRLYGQNKLLLEGWLDNDSQGRLSLMTSWDMFISRTISTVDVEQMFTEFGPKMYINVNKGVDGRDELTITADRFYCSPVANWSVPFYMAGYANQEANNTIFDYGTSTEFQAPLEFDVELSEDLNTLTIKAIDYDGIKYYPNVVGINSISLFGNYILENPIVSDVVLTRGWDGAGQRAVSGVTQSGGVATKIMGSPSKSGGQVRKQGSVNYNNTSGFSSKKDYLEIKGEVITYEKLQENLAAFAERQRCK